MKDQSKIKQYMNMILNVGSQDNYALSTTNPSIYYCSQLSEIHAGFYIIINEIGSGSTNPSVKQVKFTQG